MKIKQELPQFEDKKALLIVSGKKEAKFYLANAGEVKKIDQLLPEEFKYSDNEGYFETRAMGKVVGSGSVRERMKNYLIQQFSDKLADKTLSLDKENKFDEIYLFSPDYMKNWVRENLSPQLIKKIVLQSEGNYVQNPPFDLLEKIKKYEEEKRPAVPHTKEVDKLMKKKLK